MTKELFKQHPYLIRYADKIHNIANGHKAVIFIIEKHPTIETEHYYHYFDDRRYDRVFEYQKTKQFYQEIQDKAKEGANNPSFKNFDPKFAAVVGGIVYIMTTYLSAKQAFTDSLDNNHMSSDQYNTFLRIQSCMPYVMAAIIMEYYGEDNNLFVIRHVEGKFSLFIHNTHRQSAQKAT